MKATTTSQINNHELINDLREAYMEIIPTTNIEAKLRILEPDSYVAVTCSPTKGVDETKAKGQKEFGEIPFEIRARRYYFK